MDGIAYYNDLIIIEYPNNECWIQADRHGYFKNKITDLNTVCAKLTKYKNPEIKGYIDLTKSEKLVVDKSIDCYLEQLHNKLNKR